MIKSWNIPLKVVSEANISEHWATGHKRHKMQKRVIRYLMSDIALYRDIPIIIKLIRISPRKFDKKDNLPMSFKYIADEIARLIYPEKEEVKLETIRKNIEHNSNLKPDEKPIRIRFQNAGRADDTDLIEWEYDQEKGPGSIRVELYKNGSE